MTATANFSWDQGADLSISLVYKEGPTAAQAVPLNLSENYAVRMDLVTPSKKERIYTFNSEEIPDVNPLLEGDQSDTYVETTLGSGAAGEPNIRIVVPRSLTLPGGAVYAQMTGSPRTLSFNYDIFLRHTLTNVQSKILQGVVTVKESYTLWQ